nr:F-box/FBD/LRR-repeat protein At1g13570-like [Ipomoea batatas]
MAQRRRIKTLPDSSSDLISNLPVEIKDRILERLPIRDAARTALLSTHWNDAWLQHGRLAFDSKFFWRFGKSKGRSSLVPYVKIITYILLQRVRPVKKFSLFICYSKLFDPKLEQSDLDQWFRFLSRNGVEELDISLGGSEYKLPFCVFSCPTVKQLILCRLICEIVSSDEADVGDEKGENEKDCEIMMIKTNQLEAGELKYYGDTTKELNEVPAAHYLLDNHIEVGVSKQKRDSAKGVIEAGGLNKKAVFTS